MTFADEMVKALRPQQRPGMQLASMRSPYPDLPETLDGPITDPKAEVENWIQRGYQYNNPPGRNPGEMQDEIARDYFNSNVLGLTSPYEKGLWR